MGYLVQSFEMSNDVTIDAATTIGTMKVRAEVGDVFLLIYSGLVSIADTNNRGLFGLSETNGGSSVSCKMSTNVVANFHSLAGGMVVAFADGDFDVSLIADTVV